MGLDVRKIKNNLDSLSETILLDNMDKSIACKWLISGGIQESSWKDKEYLAGEDVGLIFLSLLTKEEASSYAVKIIHSFSEWSNDLDLLAESVLGKENSAAIYSVKNFYEFWTFNEVVYERNLEILLGSDIYTENFQQSKSGSAIREMRSFSSPSKRTDFRVLEHISAYPDKADKIKILSDTFLDKRVRVVGHSDKEASHIKIGTEGVIIGFETEYYDGLVLEFDGISDLVFPEEIEVLSE